MRFTYERPSSGRRCDQYTVFCGSKLVHPSIQFSPVPKAPAKPLPEASKPEGTVYEAFTAALPGAWPGIEARARADGLRQSHAVDRVVELVGLAFPEQDAVREAVPLEPCLVLVGRKNPDDRIDCRVVERFECFVVPREVDVTDFEQACCGRRGRIRPCPFRSSARRAIPLRSNCID